MSHVRSVSKLSLYWAIASGIASHAAFATPNLVVNGSFEGANGLAGWTIGGTVSDGALPVAIAYNQASLYPSGAQNEIVPTDNAPSPSPDPAGNKAVYFVTDEAKNLSVSQTVYLTPGSYQIGFDSYDTFNGSVQPNDATLTAQIAGVQLANFSASSVAPGVWTLHSGEADILTAGNYLVSFVFNTPNTPVNPDPTNPGGIYNAKDILIDRAYVLAATDNGGIPIGGTAPISTVPEPSSLIMLAGSLVALGSRSRRVKAGLRRLA